MRASSPFFNLKWLVECRWPNKPYWETMCAFNAEVVAINYAKSCDRNQKNDKTKLHYRVRERDYKGWRVIFTTEENYNATV